MNRILTAEQWCAKAWDLFEGEQYVDAISAFNMALEQDMHHADAYWGRACCYRLIGNHSLSVKNMKSAAHLGSEEAAEFLQAHSEPEEQEASNIYEKVDQAFKSNWLLSFMVLLALSTGIFFISYQVFGKSYADMGVNAEHYNDALVAVKVLDNPTELRMVCEHAAEQRRTWEKKLGPEPDYNTDTADTFQLWRFTETLCYAKLDSI